MTLTLPEEETATGSRPRNRAADPTRPPARPRRLLEPGALCSTRSAGRPDAGASSHGTAGTPQQVGRRSRRAFAASRCASSNVSAWDSALSAPRPSMSGPSRFCRAAILRARPVGDHATRPNTRTSQRSDSRRRHCTTRNSLHDRAASSAARGRTAHA